jgi:hypothetical protein
MRLRRLWGSEMRFGVSCGQLRSVVILVGESAENLFPAQGADDPFADRVGSRRPRRADQDPDAFRGEYGIERADELARPVPDQELNRRRALPQVHQEVAEGLVDDPRSWLGEDWWQCRIAERGSEPDIDL